MWRKRVGEMEKHIGADEERRRKLAAEGVDREGAETKQRDFRQEKNAATLAKRTAKGVGKRGGLLSDEMVKSGSKTCSPPKPESAASTLNLTEFNSGSGSDVRFGDKCTKKTLANELAARDKDVGPVDRDGVPKEKVEVLLVKLAEAEGYSAAFLAAARAATPRTPIRIEKKVSLDRPKLKWA